MYFTYDPMKSKGNLEKHGIGFEEAQELWQDPWRRVEVLVRNGERRNMLLARYGGTVWVAIFAMRGETVRIISVRRATGKEISAYDRARNE